ncbi:MAG: YggS family pyridoxal phosphate-dependent enzyme [Burkholderiaceae bacterium]|nr:YggS family pyridoxal phosphate-dependent enzyme [Burkholderiaceae bacterium]
MNGDPLLRERYERLAARLRAACHAAGRDPGEVRVLAVSKTIDTAGVLELAALGQRAFGENYLQEAQAKIAGCALERPDLALEWHFIGPIQSNKTRPIAEHFAWVHSIEREKIARRLSEQRAPGAPALQACIQVNASGEPSKSGCAPGQALELARAVAALPGLRLRGVMAIPEPAADYAAQRAQFAAVRAVFETLRDAGLAVDTLSVGMSDDLEAAVAEGATIVRIGTALFGPRTRSAQLRPLT